MLFTVVKTGVFTWAYAVFASVPELSHGYTLELYSDLLLGAGFWDFLVPDHRSKVCGDSACNQKLAENVEVWHSPLWAVLQKTCLR